MDDYIGAGAGLTPVAPGAPAAPPGQPAVGQPIAGQPTDGQATMVQPGTVVQPGQPSVELPSAEQLARNHGRDKLEWAWTQEVWKRIDLAVLNEANRTKVAAKFIPVFGPLNAAAVPSDTINLRRANLLTVPEEKIISLVEVWVQFALTQQQVEGEQGLYTAVTLATRATNFLSQAVDSLIFLGRQAPRDKPELFRRVERRAQSLPEGLLDAVPPGQSVTVKRANQKPDPPLYGENTFAAVAEAYSRLQGRGHYGPYALVLHSDAYADTYRPLKTTLIIPADRIKPLVDKRFYGTGTLRPFTGLLMSLGGSSMDVVCGMYPTTVFGQEDPEGLYRFRVVERFTLRLRDETALVGLEFDQ